MRLHREEKSRRPQPRRSSLGTPKGLGGGIELQWLDFGRQFVLCESWHTCRVVEIAKIRNGAREDRFGMADLAMRLS